METTLGRDVFFALAAIGWADGHLDGEEADAIVRTALEDGLELEVIAELEEATKKPVKLEEIDLSSMTKADRLFIFAVAEWMTRLDGIVTQSEKEALLQLAKALKVPDKPREQAVAIAKEIAKLTESDKPPFYNLAKLRKTLKTRLAMAQQLRATNRSDAEGEP